MNTHALARAHHINNGNPASLQQIANEEINCIVAHVQSSSGKHRFIVSHVDGEFAVGERFTWRIDTGRGYRDPASDDTEMEVKQIIHIAQSSIVNVNDINHTDIKRLSTHVTQTRLTQAQRAQMVLTTVTQ